MTLELLTGEEEVVYGDSGYIGAKKRENAITRKKNYIQNQSQTKSNQTSLQKWPVKG